MYLISCLIVMAALSSTHGLSGLSATNMPIKKSREEREMDSCETCTLQSVTLQLAKQLELQRLFIEERIRADGGSGIKQTRLGKKGTKTYHSNSFTGLRVAAIHEHSDHYNTVGLGEFVAVLNGVEFRTRHNDYMLKSPHKTDSGWSGEHSVEEIPYPAVPPEVTNLENVADQIVEMREWFKAWQDEDDSVRDYKQYFKPLLCYLEGAWTLPESDAVEEGFESDRHIIDASSWFDLQEKIKFTSYSGKKEVAENFAYLPTTIIEVPWNESLYLTVAQWNYRIVCHPLSRDLPPSRLRLIDDLHSRMSAKRSMDVQLKSRAARFQVNVEDRVVFKEQVKVYQLMDELMEEIPGADNYQGNLQDDALGETAMKFRTSTPLNVAYYHGWYSGSPDAMGDSDYHRGFADENLYMAMTSQPRVAPMSVEKCVHKNGQETCATYKQRWTYAIPLEIVYLTPLHSWNPYHIEYKGLHKSDLGLTVEAGGTRTGEATVDKAFNGTHSKNFYQIPAEFFTDDNGVGDTADTAAGIVSVLDPSGDMHSVVASGVRVHLPEIPDVGIVRTRYPIMPSHEEGSAAWKEIDALKDLLLNPKTYRNMYHYNDVLDADPEVQVLRTLESDPDANNITHHHFLSINREDVDMMNADINTFTVDVTTTKHPADGHYHTMSVYKKDNGFFRFSLCDGKWKCPDGHKGRLDCSPDFKSCDM